MRRYKTSCFNCGKETRDTKKSSKPIDVCASCVKEAKSFDEVEYQKKLKNLIMPKNITNTPIHKTEQEVHK